MPKPEEPLNEISLNTPAGKHYGLTMALDKLSEIKSSKEDNSSKEQNTAGYVAVRLSKISILLRQKGANKLGARECFTELYRVFTEGHSTSFIKPLVKQHLTLIVNLLNENQPLEASREILHLYNETNMDRSETLHDILLNDYTACNAYYLSTLKVLVMQVLLKTKTSDDYQHTLILLFSMDRRYLLKDPKLKIHSVVKLLLNFFTQLPEIKLLLGVKFLQYIHQFNLPFDTYVRNMGEESFKQQLRLYIPISSEVCQLHLKSFYASYLGTLSADETSPASEILELYSTTPTSGTSIQSLLALDPSSLGTSICHYSTNVPIDLARQCLHDTRMSKCDALQRLKVLWNCIRFNGQTNDKSKVRLLDGTLLFLNSSLHDLRKATADLFDLLIILIECCFDISEHKRLGNVTNILFNGYVVLREYKFIEMAASVESRIFLMDNERNEKSIRKIAEKFEKYISNTPDLRKKLEIFSKIFNFHFLQYDESLPGLQNSCHYIYLKCYRKLKLKSFVNFTCCSEVMLALFYARCPLTATSDVKMWSPMAKMLYFCISGMFYLGSININPPADKYHMLYKYEVLIKTCYCFNLEMSKHSNSNLSTITRSYIEKWIHKCSPIKEKISYFETDFVRMLLQYLEFNHFDKLLIELIAALKVKVLYFSPLITEIGSYEINAYTSLQLSERIASMKNDPILHLELTTISLETLIHHVGTRIGLFSWENDSDSFEKMFTATLPKVRGEIFDIDNKQQVPVSTYVKILLLNVKILITASKFHMKRNDMVAAVTESKKALKLSISLLKKIDKISQGSRLKLIQCLAQSFMHLIKLYIHVGISRDCEFYIKELSRVICELGEPSVVFHCLTFLYKYYDMTGQENLKLAALKKSNKTFDFIDGHSNILALTTFFFINKEPNKIFESLKLFFGNTIEETFFPYYWRLKLGQDIEDQKCPDCFKEINTINKINNQYRKILKSMEKDPFFKNVFESLLAIPSCQLPGSVAVPDLSGNPEYATPCKNQTNNIISPTSRSSNMTPRGKNLKQKFDRTAAVSNLVRLKKAIESVKIGFLKNEDLTRVSSLYSLTLSLLSNIGTFILSKNDLLEQFALSELPKSLPMYYDKKLNVISNDIYDEFTLLPLNEYSDPVSTEKQKLIRAQKAIASNETPFNIISLDICPVTENLLLSRTDSITNKKIHVRIPLDRVYTRDLDSMNLTFSAAKDELSNIIEESNKTTSLEVTSSINSKEERKRWWQMRHNLDIRLEELLSKIQTFWFSSFKAFFSPEVIDQSAIEAFKLNFNHILHQNLPSRKQQGNSESFLQIDDWIIEWIMKLDPQDVNFVSMVEDLMYFILDILLFHGEENAYDEIDFSVIHIKIEEQIRKFQSHVANSTRFQHTFLIVSGSLHMFPWECLPFFKYLSITRIPSYGCLDDLLRESDHRVFLPISLQSRISMILNPHGDLSKTESRFAGKFRQIATSIPNSKVIINEKPTEELFLQSLEDSNLFIYLGHGGGEQYARLKEIKRLDSIAPSFLLGCSSAFMSSYGKLEPTGTIYAYLLAGCPLVLGNLWDVTDKDIDKFSESVFEKIGLMEKDLESAETLEQGYTISSAIAQSREVCFLKYLNGAAPVAYGLPIKFA
ncbi:hypothetical protein HG535_0B06080 [Zygotorulaspora mrakii]|uniref:separase n=1 Tax=Zygotorulaspora mrakii TaxID=42260 RepID=A0A7H9AZP6_ZYGMR|nr:uncharacterized protein HG535_0B06080 [Zygotorulaspora mrakii]QLG71564.1 hypothetical protein HG535_0B06080 [Zygotorulaspora mrakii]